MSDRGIARRPGGRYRRGAGEGALPGTARHSSLVRLGGSRLAQTRLRVVVRTAGGSTLYVRDGQIKVSIARIKSGALPGLAGIL